MPGTANGSANGSRGWPENVGILNLDFYFPSEFVEQKELEVHDKVSQGKYTIGLGQTRMAICSDREDIHSICLTVTKRLMEKSGISSKDVGFLMVGTETLIDKSKSVKTVLMQLFEDSGNFDVQGIDTTNACFGGTASLFHALDWIESSSWDGRFAVVVCGDIAVYEKGPARPTGGAGAVAMLIGPNAPLVIDRGVRTHYMKNAYDFYKPDFNSEYPKVQGTLSVSCYMEAVYNSYSIFRKKFAHVNGLRDSDISVNVFDGLVFHAPYCKIVSKALARIVFNDFNHDPSPDFEGKYKGLEQYQHKTVEETAMDKNFETAFVKVASDVYDRSLQPSLFAATEVGNMYTASVYACLISYLNSKSAKELAGKKALVFSYGSGLAASMFSISLSSDASPGSALHRIQAEAAASIDRFKQRIKLTPEEFSKRLSEREEAYMKAPFTPKEDLDVLYPGTYYLNEVDKEWRRSYSRKPLNEVSSKIPPASGIQSMHINAGRV